MEHQQYGHWIRVSQFSPARRQYIEVKGYDKKGPQSSTKDVQTEGRIHQMRLGNFLRLTRDGETVEATPKGQGSMVEQRACSPKSTKANLRDPGINGNSSLNKTGAIFVAMIEDIDKEILNDGKAFDPVVTEIIKELRKEGTKLDTSGNDTLNEEAVGKCPEIEVHYGVNAEVSEVGGRVFTLGWAEPKGKNKGPKKSKEVGEGVLKEGTLDVREQDVNKENKKGYWTRMPTKPPAVGDHDMGEFDLG